MNYIVISQDTNHNASKNKGKARQPSPSEPHGGSREFVKQKRNDKFKFAKRKRINYWESILKFQCQQRKGGH